MAVNRRILLVRRPVGDVADDCFAFVEAPVPEPGPGEAVVRVQWISLDPAIRGWMMDEPSYLPPTPLGEPVRSGAVGEVVASNAPEYPVGSHVFGFLGWQDYAVIGGATDVLVQPLPPGIDPVDALGLYGSTGLTAYFGVTDVARAVAGETFVVSGAAGGVGSVAGQVAKIIGCRVIGIAGSDEKCRWVVDDLGFDACINYKTEDVGAALDRTCPDGIDVYFDNVGGPILEQVLARINDRARIALCGSISQYNAIELAPGPRNLLLLTSHRARIEGFLLLDYLDRFFDGILQLGQWVEEGRIKHRNHVVEGLENTPKAFRMLFSGDNIGKLVVKVGERAP